MTKVRIDAHDDGVRVIVLNDPERRNILAPQLCADLLNAVKTVRADPDTRAVIVTGEGSAFCGGADMPAVFGKTDRSVSQFRDDLHGVYESFLSIRDLGVPVIAAVHGPAVGAGLNLAMVCDVRVAGPDSIFAATFSRIGLHPGGGCTWFLVQAMGRDRALKMLLDGGNVKAQQAVDVGVATVFADDPMAEALKLASRWSTIDPQLTRDIKTAVEIAAKSDLATTLEFESWAQASAATKPALAAYVDTFRK